MSDAKSWNLWHGCRKCSEGCENCYVFFTDGLRGVPEKASAVARTKQFDMPLRKDRRGVYKVPAGTMLSVNMTSDTFIEEADEWRPEMWSIIRKRPDVLFYILTKRPERIAGCLPDNWGDGWENVILNISVENQRNFDARWPVFEKVPAKHKGLNLAPLIGPVDISPALASGQIHHVMLSGEAFGGDRPCCYEWIEQVSGCCRRYNVNLAVNLVGNVFVRDGSPCVTRSFDRQAEMAYDLGLSYHAGDVDYKLRHYLDKHILAEDEKVRKVYNSDRCVHCTNIRYCTGCSLCMKCKPAGGFVSFDDVMASRASRDSRCLFYQGGYNLSPEVSETGWIIALTSDSPIWRHLMSSIEQYP